MRSPRTATAWRAATASRSARVLDLLAAAGRLTQYAAAALVFGLPAFRLYGLRDRAGAAPRAILAGGAVALGLGVLAVLAAQSAAMTGDPAAVRAPSVWADVVAGSQFGHAVGLRLVLSLLALGLALAPGAGPRRGPMLLVGGLVAASFAWTGHGAAGEGWNGRLQLAADVAHLLAAALWLGALAGLGLAARAARRQPALGPALLGALEGFAGVGTLLVAVLTLTGLVNSWYLVTPAQVPRLLESAYGALLLLKVALFAVMLGCAVLNRFRLAPGLRAAPMDAALARALRLSLAVETLSGVGVLALVAALGLLPPPAALT